jgi:uncharacterized membrane protein
VKPEKTSALFRLLALLPLLAYPFIVLYALDSVGPAGLGVLLVCLLLVRHASDVRKYPWLLGVAGIVLAFFWWLQPASSEQLLRFYPVFINLSFLIGFGYTLFRPPTVAERLAILSGREITAMVRSYTRGVTWVWCVFFAINGSVAALIALSASMKVWAFYNGFLAYVLMGALLAGEYIYRQFRMARVAD